MVLHNGNVLTVDNDDPDRFGIAQAVAVYGERIVAVGTDAEVRTLSGPETLEIDLAGNTVLPGLIDTHSHIHDYGMRHYGDQLTEAPYFWGTPTTWAAKEEGLAQVEQIASQKKPGEWLRLQLGDTSRDLPIVWKEVTRYDLDRAAPENPVYLQLASVQNAALINSRALDVLYEKYPRGLPGIGQDERGNPTGLIRGVAAATIFQEFIPKPSTELLGPIYKKEMEEWVSMGITTISSRLPPYSISTYAALERSGEMPLRMAYNHQVANDSPDPIAIIGRLGDLTGAGTEHLWFNGLSPTNIDGIASMAWGCLDRHYLQEHPRFPLWRHRLWGPHGECTLTSPAFSDRALVVGAVRLGHRVTGMHVGGDRSMDEFLDLLEETDTQGTVKDRRFAVDHCRYVDDTHVERAKRFNLMFSCAPKYVYGGAGGDVGIFSAIYGEDIGGDVVVPMRRLIDAGVEPVMEIDTHAMYSFLNLEVFITRRDRDGRVWGPQQRIDRREALYTFTRWAAKYVLRENELGSIEAGKKADLVIIDRDYLSVPEEEISEIIVLATLVGGKIQYTEPRFARGAGLPDIGFRGTPSWTEPGT
jgi:predicted amidohydrolase YtcJ